MAACGSLEHIFDKPLPENQTFLESLSPWKHIKSSIDESSFTEIFGELHFKENKNVHNSFPESSPSSSLSSDSTSSTFSAQTGIDIPKKDENKNPKSSSYCPSSQKKQYKHSDSFSSMNSENLSLCTEGLGFESFDDVEDLMKNDHVCNNNEGIFQEERKSNLTRNIQKDHENHHHHKNDYFKRSRICRGDFPPPISCIGRSGKPWVCFKSYRQDGRFILKEIRIPTQEFLHACREDGRLRLQFIHSDDEIFEDDDEEDEDDIEEQNKVDDDDDKEENLEGGNCDFQRVHDT